MHSQGVRSTVPIVAYLYFSELVAELYLCVHKWTGSYLFEPGNIFLRPSSISTYNYDVIVVVELPGTGSGFWRHHSNFSFAKMQFRMPQAPSAQRTEPIRPKHARA